MRCDSGYGVREERQSAPGMLRLGDGELRLGKLNRSPLVFLLWDPGLRLISRSSIALTQGYTRSPLRGWFGGLEER